jgi:hypothetical protein
MIAMFALIFVQNAGVALQHAPPTPFIVVTLISTLVLLGGWRAAYVQVRGPESAVFRRGGVFDGINMVSTLLRRW